MDKYSKLLTCNTHKQNLVTFIRSFGGTGSYLVCDTCIQSQSLDQSKLFNISQIIGSSSNNSADPCYLFPHDFKHNELIKSIPIFSKVSELKFNPLDNILKDIVRQTNHWITKFKEIIESQLGDLGRVHESMLEVASQFSIRKELNDILSNRQSKSHNELEKMIQEVFQKKQNKSNQHTRDFNATYEQFLELQKKFDLQPFQEFRDLIFRRFQEFDNLLSSKKLNEFSDSSQQLLCLNSSSSSMSSSSKSSSSMDISILSKHQSVNESQQQQSLLQFFNTKFPKENRPKNESTQFTNELTVLMKCSQQFVSQILDNSKGYMLKLKFSEPLGNLTNGNFRIGLIENSRKDKFMVLENEHGGFRSVINSGAQLKHRGKQLLTDQNVLPTISQLEFRWCILEQKFFIADASSSYTNINQVEKKYINEQGKYNFGIFYNINFSKELKITITDFKEINPSQVDQFPNQK